MDDELKREIQEEAIARQGKTIECRGRRYKIDGNQKGAAFKTGAEGLVHPAIEEDTGHKYRIKCFWEPDDTRLARSQFLVKQKLAKTTGSTVDVLAGAPFELVDTIGGRSRFALLMNNIEGKSWKESCENADLTGEYPPQDWPTFTTRLVWAFGLATAVERMENRRFVHADLSDGNIVLVPTGKHGARIALVDFDAYFNPKNPSHYRGTEDFVAPEIWNRGSTGVGSDRVAMSILIQDLLLTGDPDMNAEEAFAHKYKQDQLCRYEGDAHPLLTERYPKLAGLLEDTLRTRARDRRPAPQQWRQALREISELHADLGRGWGLDSIPENPNVRIVLRSGSFYDLSRSPFEIHANVLRTRDGNVNLHVHEGAQVQLKHSDEPWRVLTAGQNLPISGNATFFDLRGKLQAQLTRDPEVGQLTTAEINFVFALFEAALPTPTAPVVWIRETLSKVNRQQLQSFLLGFFGMLALFIVVMIIVQMFLTNAP